MLRLFLLICIIIGSLTMFAWSITQSNNQLIRSEINAATGNCK